MCYVPSPFSHKSCLPLMFINMQNAFSTKLSENSLWIFFIYTLQKKLSTTLYKDERQNNMTNTLIHVNVLLFTHHYCIVYRKYNCLISNTNVIIGVRTSKPIKSKFTKNWKSIWRMSTTVSDVFCASFSHRAG